MLMKLTIWPTEARPMSFRYAPTSNLTDSVSVVPTRVSTAATAHHDRTGICARSNESTELLRLETSSSTRA